MIEIDGITVRGCISFDRSKKDTSSSGKVTWHKRWEAEAGYYGVAFRKRSKHRAILEDFLLDLHQLDKGGLLKEICEKCKEVDGGKNRWNINSLPAGIRGLVEHSMSSKKESFAINQEEQK